MRKVGVIAAAAGAALVMMVAPSLASASTRESTRTAQCACVESWIGAYTTIGWVHDRVGSQMKQRGVPKKKRKQINYALYEYAGHRDFNTGFCRRHKKACAAAAACIAGAVASLTHEPKHHTWHGMWARAATACAAAATPVILTA